MTAALIVTHPDGMVVLADSRRMNTGKIDSDHSQKIFKISSQMVLLHVGWVGSHGNEVGLFAERFQRDTGERTLRSAAWLLRDNVNVIWENMPANETSTFILVGKENDLFGFYEIVMRQGKKALLKSYFTQPAKNMEVDCHILGDGVFQKLLMAGPWFDNLDSLEAIKARGELLINRAHSWVEACGHTPTFNDKIQIAVIDKTGKVTLAR